MSAINWSSIIRLLIMVSFMVHRRKRGESAADKASAGPDMAARGGQWSLLTGTEIDAIAQAAVTILTKIGVSDPSDQQRQIIVDQGGSVQEDRLLYPVSLVEAALEDGPKEVLLAGQQARNDMLVGADRVFTGTGGAAPFIRDDASGDFRPSTLGDLHDAARLADALPHVHFFARSLVATDIADPHTLDLATAAASLAGTSKHVIVQATHASHVADIARLCHDISGSELALRARPFLSLNINHIVPPLRSHQDSFNVMAMAVRAGIPVHCNVFGQVGASSPVTLAGAAAQTLAEVLAGLAFVHAIDPKAPRIAGPRPMITDLRSGGMAGGAGEQSMANALVLQVLKHFKVPCSIIAGATDSKSPDAQSGYEKALSITTSLQAGAHLITQAAGSQASLMAVCFGAMVADNEMLGAILRAHVSPRIDEETLALGMIEEVVKGEGHYLGQPQTYERMRSDFLYPALADRQSIEQWRSSDRSTMEQRSARLARELLDRHWPTHLSDDQQRAFERKFGLRFAPEYPFDDG